MSAGYRPLKFLDRLEGNNHIVLLYDDANAAGYTSLGDIDECVTWGTDDGCIAGTDNNVDFAADYVNAAAGNYRIDSGAAVIDQGDDLGQFRGMVPSFTIDQDLDGAPRPQDGNTDSEVDYDIGAFEYQPT